MKTLLCIFTLLACTALVPAQAKRLPTVSQVVDSYIAATGGRTALLNIRSQHSTGTVKMLGVDHNGTYETYVKAPNKLLSVLKMNIGEIRVGFDGDKSWIQAPESPAAYDSPGRQIEMKREADLYLYLNFTDRFPKARVIGVQKVDEVDTYVIEAFRAGESDPEVFYFDIKSGFLIQRESPTHDAEGKKATNTQFYDDYREVDGVKSPFVVRLIQGAIFIESRQLVLKNNVSIADSTFKLPVSKP